MALPWNRKSVSWEIWGECFLSFASTVKEELFRITNGARHCRLAELSAMISVCGKLEADEGNGRILKIQTENEAVLRKCFTLLEKTFNIKAEICFRAKDVSGYGTEGTWSALCVRNADDIAAILQGGRLCEAAFPELSLMSDTGVLLQAECCQRAYIRGVFLCAGTLSDPKKGYHLEMTFPVLERAEAFSGLLQAQGLSPHTSVRKKSYTVYFKEGTQIADLLAMMGAGISMMDMENVRIMKQMRNSINRRVNCETANIHKTVQASVKQVEDILFISSKLGLEELPASLSKMAALRLAYPDASLIELGLMSEPQIGKSGVNHRLRRLGAIADELRRNEEEKGL